MHHASLFQPHIHIFASMSTWFSIPSLVLRMCSLCLKYMVHRSLFLAVAMHKMKYRMSIHRFVQFVLFHFSMLSLHHQYVHLVISVILCR